MIVLLKKLISDLDCSDSEAFNYVLCLIIYFVIYHYLGGDYGDYICEGRNSLGSNYATINLFGNYEFLKEIIKIHYRKIQLYIKSLRTRVYLVIRAKISFKFWLLMKITLSWSRRLQTTQIEPYNSQKRWVLFQCIQSISGKKNKFKFILRMYKLNYSCVFGIRNYKVLARVCVCVCLCVCVCVSVFVCVCFCMITQKKIDLGTRNWNTS